MSILDTKNISPRVLSTFNSLIIALAAVLCGIYFRLPWLTVLIVFAVVFGLVYWLFYYTLQHFLYRKIKLIYKFINQTKATKREEFFNNHILPKKTIDDASEDVQKWANRHREELDILRNNEQFRKEFLMNLAHELRTPIFTVQGYVETLLGGALEDETVNRKFLSNTSKSIDRLVQLVDDLDEISKLEAGHTPIVKEGFPIQELVLDVYEEFSLQAAEKNMELIIKKGTERPVYVNADKAKIRQVIVNLVENALKYTPANGTITTGNYEVDEGNVYVEISDNGPGIAEEHLPRIFERFYRADRNRSRNVGGTGLGLAIVKHIVEAHGQTVTARSKTGVGSSFGFTLEKGRA